MTTVDKGSRPAKARALLSRLRNYLVAGILVTVPASVTIWVLYRFFLSPDWILLLVPANWSVQDVNIKELLGSIPGLGAILTIVVVIIVGFLVTNIVGRRAVKLWESLIQRLPVISTIYQGVKQLLEAIFTSDSSRFDDVVYLEFPRKGMWSLGFVTGAAFEGSCEKIGQPCVNVFVPTTPNPTNGFFLMVPRSDLIYSGLSVEDAFKLIMSAGIVTPKMDDGDGAS